MEKHAYQLGVLQALEDIGLLKTAQQAPSIEEMKDNIYRQQAARQAGISVAPFDPMRSPTRNKGPIQVPQIGGTAKPEAGVASAAKAVPKPAAKLTPQLAGSAASAAPPKGKMEPSAYGTEAYEKGFGQGGAVEKRRRLLRSLR